MLFLAVLLQDEDVAAPFGSFMDAMPHWAFIAEVCDVLALVTIALGFAKRAGVAPFVAGTTQHR